MRHLRLCKTLIDKHYFDLNVADSDGWTPLHYLAKRGSYELFDFLANNGTFILFTTKGKKNCLHIAVFYGHLNLCRTLIEKLNFNVDITDTYGQRACHYSLRNRGIEIIKYFADKGTDLAADKTEVEVGELLLAHAVEISEHNHHEDVLNALNSGFDNEGMFLLFSLYYHVIN